MKKSGGSFTDRGDSKCKGLTKEQEEARSQWLRQEARHRRRRGRKKWLPEGVLHLEDLGLHSPQIQMLLRASEQRTAGLHLTTSLCLWERNRLEGTGQKQRLVRKLFFAVIQMRDDSELGQGDRLWRG